MELETQLVLSVQLDFTTKESCVPIWSLSQEAGRLINGLRRRMEDIERGGSRPNANEPTDL
jgi:hypothetical protein